MDWQHRTREFLTSMLRSRFQRGLIVALLIVACLVAVQVGNDNAGQPPMCELISHCQLRHGDLQRMQVALGQSGLSQFKVEEDRLMVPRLQHAEYLQAVSEKNALPTDLRDRNTQSASVNPFLSSSQQKTLERDRKKRQVQEMILRLPFVQQAWFEMDVAETNSPFARASQSAVVSIEPVAEFSLNRQHVDTIRRMVGGAVAGLKAEEIEVIDVTDGFAYGCPTEGHAQPLDDPLRLRLERQRALEDQIRLTLAPRYQGVDVQVQLIECEQWTESGQNGEQQHDEPLQTQVPVHKAKAIPPAKLVAGSNGVVSIFDTNEKIEAPVSVQAVSFTKPKSEPNRAQNYRVAVQVNLPESALERVALSLVNRATTQNGEDEVQLKFNSVRPQIQRETASLLPADLLKRSGLSGINVNLLRSELPTALDTKAQLAAMFERHWPSVATLIIGLMLLSMVTRKSGRTHPVPSFEPSSADVLPMNAANLKTHKSGAEQEINQMLQTNPDTAAKAIEGWIRNAG